MFLLWIIGAVLAVYAAIKLDERAENERQAAIWCEEWNEKAPLYPADDWDSWPELENYMERNPGLREQYERDALRHREGVK